MINLGEALQIVLAVSLLRWCEATLACNTLASALLCSLSPSYFQHLPRTASESCSGAGVYSCSLKRLPLLTPLNKTHSSATLNFRPCFYCFSKHCNACNLTTKRSILQPTPCCSQCEWLGHLYPAEPLRRVRSSDRQVEGNRVFVWKGIFFLSTLGCFCITFKCYFSWEMQSGWKLAVHAAKPGIWQPTRHDKTRAGRNPSAQRRSWLPLWLPGGSGSTLVAPARSCCGSDVCGH